MNESRAFSFVLELNPMAMARQNARTIVENSTAYPFRLPESVLMCVFCCETFPEAVVFRRHMVNEHKDFKPHLAFAHITDGYIKVDITDLSCRICKKPFISLDDLAFHLKEIHFKKINLDFDLGLQPFRLENDKYACTICDTKAANLCSLSRHIQKHFKQCICENCGKSYATTTSLAYHVKNSCKKDGLIRCRKCRVVVTSIVDHLNTSKQCRQHICSMCGERFATWHKKHAHMEEAHALPKKTFPCPECGNVYAKHENLKAHFKIAHTNDYFECVHCGMKCSNRNQLSKHVLVHTGEKAFACNVCSKCFPRKSTLNQHMWIHSEIKKHVCKICDKPFNQKVCWKTHMKSQHPELYDSE